jgi:RNA polymerase sigma-70 factor (ECF subfamily)
MGGEVIPLRTGETGAELRALQERFRDGDPEAFEALVRPHLDQIYTFCLRVAGNHPDGYDLAHDALLRARRKHHLYQPGRPIRPWLMRIAQNAFRSRLRSPWHRMRQVLSGFERQSAAASPEGQTADSHRDEVVRTVLATLPPKYREAVALFHLQDMSYAEMVEITGVSEAALKQRVRRGNKILAQKIERLYPELVPGRRPDDD